MNYDKKTQKHYALLCSDEYAKNIENYLNSHDLFGAASLLRACCSHYFSTGKPAFYSTELKNCIIDLLSDPKKNDADLKFGELAYPQGLLALTDYIRMTGEQPIVAYTDYFAEKILGDMFLSGDDCFDGKKAFALRALANHFLHREKLPEILSAARSVLPFYSAPHAADIPSLCIANGAIGLLLLSNEDGEFLSCAKKTADFFIKNNSSLIYSAGENFSACDRSDPFAAAAWFLFFTLLYKKTGNDLYCHQARRMWFNGLQFCQRENGGVGYDSFVSAADPVLKAETYFEKRLTPLYADALYGYEKNKALFCEEDGEVKKDRYGRYFIGDKLFARDISEFFGNDLIEIPSLTSFDEQTARQLRLKTTF